jgi:hypothetical protein
VAKAFGPLGFAQSTQADLWLLIALLFSVPRLLTKQSPRQRKPLRGLSLRDGPGPIRTADLTLIRRPHVGTRCNGVCENPRGCSRLIRRRNPLFYPVRGKLSKKSSKGENQDWAVHRSAGPYRPRPLQPDAETSATSWGGLLGTRRLPPSLRFTLIEPLPPIVSTQTPLRTMRSTNWEQQSDVGRIQSPVGRPIRFPSARRHGRGGGRRRLRLSTGVGRDPSTTHSRPALMSCTTAIDGINSRQVNNIDTTVPVRDSW